MPKSLLLLLILLSYLASSVSAESTEVQENGDWAWYFESDEMLGLAGTINGSGNMLAQACYADDQACYYIIALDISCVSDNEFPILVNASSGILNLSLVCDTILDDGTYRYYLTPFDDIDSAIRNSTGQIGFAIGLDDGKFAVERFSLNGSETTLDDMRNLTSEVIDLLEESGDSTINLKSSEIL